MQLKVAKCRICKCELRLQIDDDYDPEFDSAKLIPMATCNRCFDLRARLRKIEDSIRILCHSLSFPITDERRARAYELLRKLSNQFSQWCSDMLNRQHMADSGSLATRLMKEPSNWWKALRKFESEADSA